MGEDCFRDHVRLQDHDTAGRREGVRAYFFRFRDCVGRLLREEDGRSTRASRVRFLFGDVLCGNFNECRCPWVCGVVAIADRRCECGVLASVVRVSFSDDRRRLANYEDAFLFLQFGGQLWGDRYLFRNAYDFRGLKWGRFPHSGRFTCVIRALRR